MTASGNDADLDTSKPFERNIGAHIWRFEPPDIVWVTFVGDISGDDAAEMARMVRHFTKGQKYYTLLELSQMGTLSGEARKGIREIPVSAANANYGASPQIRLVSSIMSKVYAMLHGGADTPSKFFATEAEARAWIAELRRGS